MLRSMSPFAVLQKRSPPCAALLLPRQLILVFLVRNGVEYCCDAAYYLNSIASAGLLSIHALALSGAVSPHLEAGM